MATRRQRINRLNSRDIASVKGPEADFPTNVMSRDSYQEVNNGHIVPRMYQRAFAVGGLVRVHKPGSTQCVSMSTKRAGTRGPYYRRTRPDGTTIDDVEASLAVVEDKTAPALQQLVAGAAPTIELKLRVAQFIAVQMVRGPEFFKQQQELVEKNVPKLLDEIATPELLRAGGLDPATAESHFVESLTAETERFRDMLTMSMKVASVVANMRWSLINFDAGSLAYSDHPVVAWPANVQETEPFKHQILGPHTAIELRLPLSPTLGLLATWTDLPDRFGVPGDADAAGQFNAFTIGQAEQEWMHSPVREPDIASGPLRRLSRRFEDGYGLQQMVASRRNQFSNAFIAEHEGRRYVNEQKALNDFGPPILDTTRPKAMR